MDGTRPVDEPSMQTLGKYRLVRPIASGGMAEVFVATTSGPGGFAKYLALKRLLPHLARETDFITMFEDEARLAARFSHRNIAQVFELGVEGETYFVAMELVRGPTLAEVIAAAARAREPVPLCVCVQVGIDASAALDYAHHFTDLDGTPLCVVHRDVSPPNVALGYDGVVKLLDFGIAKAAVNLYRTRTLSLRGKVAYMSPEQIAGDALLDGRSDIFALGSVLFELACGKPPFQGESDLELMRAIMETPAPDLRGMAAEIPEALARIVSTALAKDRRQRYASALDLQRDLEGLLQGPTYVSPEQTLKAWLERLIPAHTCPAAALDLEKTQIDGRVPGPRLTDAPTTPLAPVVDTRRLEPIRLSESTGAAATLLSKRSPSLRSWARGRRMHRTLRVAPFALAAIAGLALIANTRPSADGRAAVAATPTWSPPSAPVSTPDLAPTITTSATAATALMTAQPGLALASHDAAGSIASAATLRATRETQPAAATKLHAARAPSPRARAPATSGQLVVDTRPWTEVRVDGMSYGVTPLSSPVALTTGEHMLELVNPDVGLEYNEKISIRAEETTRVQKRFRQGQLSVSSTAPSEVDIDGSTRGTTPLTLDLYEGTHVLEARCLTRPLRRLVVVKPAGVVELRLDCTGKNEHAPR